MSAEPTRRLRVAIIGGGAIGSAIAYFLTRDDRDCAVTVIERDFGYRQASSALSASSIRQQFSTAVNVRMSQYGIQFFRTIGETLATADARPEIGLVEPGYLYLASSAGEFRLRANHATQRALGVDVALLAPDDLQSRFRWLATGDLSLGSLGLSGEGWYDGYGVLQAFRRKAIAQGVRYLQAEADGFRRLPDGRTLGAVRLLDGTEVDCDVAVDAAGPWAARVAGWAGIDLPVRARRRTVFSFRCAERLPGCPLVIDPSGLWFRPEGQQFICGDAPPAESDLDDLPLDPEMDAFETRLWPSLAARVPAFEAIRTTGAWAGYYEMNTVDQNAILGVHPACPNLHVAAGFSGHGLQQAPAVGRGVAERIREGRYTSLDLSDVDVIRLLENRPLVEANVI